jgi:hypothetical protein
MLMLMLLSSPGRGGEAFSIRGAGDGCGRGSASRLGNVVQSDAGAL